MNTSRNNPAPWLPSGARRRSTPRSTLAAASRFPAIHAIRVVSRAAPASMTRPSKICSPRPSNPPASRWNSQAMSTLAATPAATASHTGSRWRVCPVRLR